MVEFTVRKPYSKDGMIRPAYFTQLFGYVWDLCYGMLVIIAISLVTWTRLDSNYYLLLIITYIDVIVFFDAVMSMFIRFFQMVQVIAVNRNIESFRTACRNVLGLWLDFTSCIPFLSLMLTTPRSFSETSYIIICMFRMGRLFTPSRKSLDKTFQDKIRERLHMESRTRSRMFLAEFDEYWQLRTANEKGHVKQKRK